MESLTISTDPCAQSLALQPNLEIYRTISAPTAPISVPHVLEGSITNATLASLIIAIIISLLPELPFAIALVLLDSIRIALISHVKFVILDA